MNEQYRDLGISSRSPVAIAAIETFADELVSHGSHCRVIFDALAADPDCALAQAYAGALFLTTMTRERPGRLRPRLRVAGWGLAVAAKLAEPAKRDRAAAMARVVVRTVWRRGGCMMVPFRKVLDRPAFRASAGVRSSNAC